MPIKTILPRQIFDSRGIPTVEVDLTNKLGFFRAAVPSGASSGVHEALELCDNDKKSYHSKSVLQLLVMSTKLWVPNLSGSTWKLQIKKATITSY